MLLTFFGVSNNDDSAGFSPLSNCPAPCVTTLPAILPANAPKRLTRDSREEGMALLLRGAGLSDMYIGLFVGKYVLPINIRLALRMRLVQSADARAIAQAAVLAVA